MDHRAQLRFVENVDNFMGFFNHILLEEFVYYSFLFMRSHYSVGFPTYLYVLIVYND